MNRFKSIGLLLGFCFCGMACAQQTNPAHDKLVWLTYSCRAKIAAKWSITLDAGYRTHDWFDKKFQRYIRPGVTWQLSKRLSVSGGYAYFESNQYLNGYEGFMRPEHRLWQRLAYTHRAGRFEFRYRFRLEERFNRNIKSGMLKEGYSFFIRTGYQIYVSCPLNAPEIEAHTLYAFASDEYFTNFGTSVLNTFDQNRAAAGLGYQLSKSITILCFYQYIYGEQTTSHRFYSYHVLNAGISQNLDFRKKIKKP